MTSNWRPSTWGDEISLEYGKSLRDYAESGGKVRVYGSNGAIGWTDKSLAEGPGIILGRKGAYRGVQYSKDPFFVIDTAYYVVPKTALDMRWLYYAIIHHRLGEIDDGSPIPSTTRAAVYVKDLDVPPSPHQKAIAAILGGLDDKIKLNRRTNATLEGMARALFKSWFVDFDPVRAKLEGRQPFGMDAATAALFPGGFVPSSLGDIPEGWGVVRLDDLLVLQRGFDLPAAQRIGGKFPVIAASGPSGTHNVTMVKGPGVVTGRSGILGKVFYVHEDFWPLNTALWIKEFKGCTPTYAYFLLRGLDFEIFNAGSAVPTLNRNHVHHLKVVKPAKKIVQVFEDFAKTCFDRIRANEEQSRTLASIRDYLLPKLISGELPIRDAEKFIEDAV